MFGRSSQQKENQWWVFFNVFLRGEVLQSLKLRFADLPELLKCIQVRIFGLREDCSNSSNELPSKPQHECHIFLKCVIMEQSGHSSIPIPIPIPIPIFQWVINWEKVERLESTQQSACHDLMAGPTAPLSEAFICGGRCLIGCCIPAMSWWRSQ